MSNKFFTANGTPASGPSGSPRARASSIACGANERALLGDCGERIEHRIALADARKRRLDDAAARWCGRTSTAAAISAGRAQVEIVAADQHDSSTEHRRRFGVVGQGEFIDQRRMAQDQVQIELDARAARPDRSERSA